MSELPFSVRTSLFWSLMSLFFLQFPLDAAATIPQTKEHSRNQNHSRPRNRTSGLGRRPPHEPLPLPFSFPPIEEGDLGHAAQKSSFTLIHVSAGVPRRPACLRPARPAPGLEEPVAHRRRPPPHARRTLQLAGLAPASASRPPAR